MEMKESGIDWINSCPASWKMSRIQNHIYEINEKNNPVKMTEILSLTNTEGVIPYSERGNQGNKSKDDLTEYKVVYKDSIVANSMNILIGSVGLSYWDGCVSPVYYVYKAKPNNDIRYFNYLFRTEAFQKELRKYANGILEIRLRVSSSDILKRNIVVPSYEEQKAIADYLDEKCKAIDIAIEEARRSIEWYKQYKRNIIHKTVCQGVNCKQEKTSKTPWIGLINSEYKEYKLKHLLKMPLQYGANESGVAYSELLPRYIRITDITLDGKLKNDGALSLPKEIAEPYILEDGDILLARSGATVGKAFIYRKEYGVCCFAGYLIRAKVNEKIVLPDFVYFCMQSTGYEQWKNGIFIQATIQNIGANRYYDYILPVPSVNEQKKIIGVLNAICPNIDVLIDEKEQLIADLQLYKKSLIYEYVTGKKKVI